MGWIHREWGPVVSRGHHLGDLLGSFRPKLHELSVVVPISKRKQTHRINTFTIRSQRKYTLHCLILGKLILWLKSVSTNDVCWRSLGFQHGSAYFCVDRSTKYFHTPSCFAISTNTPKPFTHNKSHELTDKPNKTKQST